MKKELFFPVFLLGSYFAPAFLLSASAIPSHKEVPYYLRKLFETESESKRIEFNKFIHDGIVNADLSNKRVVKELIPAIEKTKVAISSGLDRPNLIGEAGWLASAVGYFEQEKLRPVVSIPAADWMESQTQSLNGLKITVDPEKIQLHDKKESKTIVESSFIHEAVISADGKKVAYFRTSDPEADRVEIWVTELINGKKRKVTESPSCSTLLFSLNGSHLIFQTKPNSPTSESIIYKVSTKGGAPKAIYKGSLLQTIVARGRYKGDLVVFRKSKHPLGTSNRDCPYAVDASSGKEIGRIKEVVCQ